MTYATATNLFESCGLRNSTTSLISRVVLFKVRRTVAADDSDELLRQPTRARLFELLVELKRPATTEELAAAIGLHRTGVRIHLDRLEAAGLLERRRVRHGRGRPRDTWSIHPGAEPGGTRWEAYAELAAWLAGAIPPKPGRLHEVEAEGRRLGRAMAAEGPDLPAEQRLEATLAALGFRPQRAPGDAGQLCFVLGNCPYRDAVRANQVVVCTLHRGLTRGLLDGLYSGASLRAFVPRDPDEAGCLIDIETM
jgi:predicted ArsR family transcriptional regulator